VERQPRQRRCHRISGLQERELNTAGVSGRSATGYSDTTVAGGTTYTYQVSAVDAAGNESSKASTSVTTPSSGGILTVSPTDDATVDSSLPTELRRIQPGDSGQRPSDDLDWAFSLYNGASERFDKI
jgi:hypothetical protein